MLGAARAHRIPVVSQITAVYVEVIRNTPILVQIFMIFYALPQFGILLNQFTVAWLSVMIWGGAFNTENFRAGFEAVPALPRGRVGARLRPAGDVRQRDAADRLPDRAALVDQHLHLVLKNTSLMYVIGYAELTTTAINISNLTLETTEALTVLAATYLALVWTLSALIRLLESHLALPESR